MDGDSQLNLSLDLATLTLPTQHFLELPYVNVELQLRFDLFNIQLISIG